MTSNIFLQSIDDIKNSIKFSKIKICVAMIATDHKVFHNISPTLLVSKINFLKSLLGKINFCFGERSLFFYLSH